MSLLQLNVSGFRQDSDSHHLWLDRGAFQAASGFRNKQTNNSVQTNTEWQSQVGQAQEFCWKN